MFKPPHFIEQLNYYLAFTGFVYIIWYAGQSGLWT